MRIEDPRSPISQPASPPVSESEAIASRAPANRKAASEAGSDSVRLSGDLRLVDVAVHAAAVAGDVRPEAIANARALLERASLGQDPERLADRLISSLLAANDERT